MARQKRQTKASVHYVNNKEFTAAVIAHNEACKVAVANEEEKPRVSEYIGECIYKIATRLSTKPNFINYSYRDEMICDGIENTLQYINNFNGEKSQNAFAYVTQIIYFAFLRRIHKEKKQAAIKQRSIEQAGYLFDTFDTIDGQAPEPGMTNQYIDFLQENMNPINYKPRGSKSKK